MVDAHIHPLYESEPVIYPGRGEQGDVVRAEAGFEQNAPHIFQQTTATDRDESSIPAIYPGRGRLDGVVKTEAGLEQNAPDMLQQATSATDRGENSIPAVYSGRGRQDGVIKTETGMEQNALDTFQWLTSATDRVENFTTAHGGDQDQNSLVEPPKLSKNALKRIRRQEAWLEKRKEKRSREKLKKKETRMKKREEKLNAQLGTHSPETKDVVQNELQPSPPPTGIVDGYTAVAGQKRKAGENPPVAERVDGQSKGVMAKKKKINPIKVPIEVIIDCGFDDCMTEKEISSLSFQVTRCYSENRQSPMQVQLSVTSFNKRLKHRMETSLKNTHKKWKQVKFSEEEYQVTEQNRNDRNLIYLTSDSDHTLHGLEEGKTYIIGGIVDRNRHKGICHKKAAEQGIQTAKLPIGDYIKMASRVVLTTNQVVEIMLKWLECRDWQEAFLQVIPARKGPKAREVKEEAPEKSEEDMPIEYDSNGDRVVMRHPCC